MKKKTPLKTLSPSSVTTSTDLQDVAKRQKHVGLYCNTLVSFHYFSASQPVCGATSEPQRCAAQAQRQRCSTAEYRKSNVFSEKFQLSFQLSLTSFDIIILHSAAAHYSFYCSIIIVI